MRRLIALLLAIGSACIADATGGGSASAAAAPPSVLGTWTVSRLQSGIPAPVRVTVAFAPDGTVMIDGACNDRNGTFTQDGSRLLLPGLVQTAVGCAAGQQYVDSNLALPAEAEVRWTPTGIAIDSEVAVFIDSGEPATQSFETRHIELVRPSKWVQPASRPAIALRAPKKGVEAAAKGTWRLRSGLMQANGRRYAVPVGRETLRLADGTYTQTLTCRTETGTYRIDPATAAIAFTMVRREPSSVGCPTLTDGILRYQFLPTSIGFDRAGHMVITTGPDSLTFDRVA